MMFRSHRSNRALPLLPRFAPEHAQRAAGNTVVLEIERVVDCGVGGEETLG
jgi:hypothetical protein